MTENTKKLALSGILIAVGVVFSAFSIPIGVSKVLPVQHMINIIGGVLLGPINSLGIAFCTSLIRVLFGTGSLLAFPGSMIGAFLCGLLYSKYKKITAAFLGEIIGTGLIGAVLSYPIALLLMGNKEAAIFTLVLPFMMSSIAGAVIGVLLLKSFLLKGQIKLEEESH